MVIERPTIVNIVLLTQLCTAHSTLYIHSSYYIHFQNLKIVLYHIYHPVSWHHSNIV